MKKINLILVAFVCFALNGFAGTETTDNITFSVTSGTNCETVVFNLNGSRLYTAFEMSFTIPEGFVLTNFKGEEVNSVANAFSLQPTNTIIPTEETETGYAVKSHSVAANKQDDGSYKLSCMSNNSDNFTAVSGPFMKMYIKKTSSTTTDVAKFTDIHFTANEGEAGNVKAIQYDFPDASCGLSPTTGAIVNVVSDYSVDSSIYNISGMKVDKMQKNQLYIVNGKKVVK